jgi:hypothetical protein
LELAKALKEAYLTPPETDNEDNESPCALYVLYPYKGKGGIKGDTNAKGSHPELAPPRPQEAFEQVCGERFTDFTPKRSRSAFHGTFAIGRRLKDRRLHWRNLPPEPQSVRNLENYLLHD